MSCKVNKKASEEKKTQEEISSSVSNCTGGEKVVVYNYKGLSGCRYLLKLESGTYLNPLKISDERFTYDSLSEISEMMISYKEIKGAMTNCMKGKAVNITCIENIKSGLPAKGKF